MQPNELHIMQVMLLLLNSSNGEQKEKETERPKLSR